MCVTPLPPRRSMAPPMFQNCKHLRKRYLESGSIKLTTLVVHSSDRPQAMLNVSPEGPDGQSVQLHNKYGSTKQHGNADALSRLAAGPDLFFDVDTVCTIRTMNSHLQPY